MTKLLLIATAFLLLGCDHNELFNEVSQMGEFDESYKFTLIQSGKESGFLEPLMRYSIYETDFASFNKLEKSIISNQRFEEGSYYLNIELDDFLLQNHLDIINMSKSSISENKYDAIYSFYLLSDRKTFVICKVNN